VLAGVVLAASCSPRPDARSFVLVTIDTWRADGMGAGGHPAVRTPHLDRFFRGAAQFADAFAPAPTTLSSHATLLTGEWPTGHGVPRNGWPLPEGVPTLAEALRRAGFRTGAFVSSAALDPTFGLARGFDVYDAELTRAVARDQAWRPAAGTLERARTWWRARHGRRFLWVHLFEPHSPYEPAPQDFALYDTGYRGSADGSMDFLFAMWEDASLLPEDARAHLESLYHAEITGLDRAVGDFLRELASESDVLAVVTADHGESLGEHGLRFKHGPWVYDGDVRVPLALRGPGVPAGVSGATVRTLDVPRTALAWLGVPSDLAPEGADLRDWVRGGAGLAAFSEASMPWDVEPPDAYPNLRKQRAVRTSEWSFVETPWTGRAEWYRRAEDPAETGEPSEPPPGAGADLARALGEWIGRGRPREEPSRLDPRVLERLRSLGYVDRGGSAPGAP
jgi:arylsulfatase A-like enzyme